MEPESHSELDRWQVADNEKIQSKFADFLRRVEELELEHYPNMIQRMVKEEDYDNLVRFGDAFKSRSDFSQNYQNVTGTNIHVRDHYDLYAYMYVNSGLSDPMNIAMKYSVDYIKRQVEGSLTKSRGTQTSSGNSTTVSTMTDTEAILDCQPDTLIIQDSGMEEQDEATEIRNLIFECCQDQKHEMFEDILGYINIVTDDLYAEIELMRHYLSDQRIHDLRLFCDNKHELKMIKPYNLFITLTPDERMEIISGVWKSTNLYNRSPFYVAFLIMMYSMEVITSKEICIRHPFLMVNRGYMDELAISIVSFSRSETVIRRIVASYAENFRLDEANLIVLCLNKLT